MIANVSVAAPIVASMLPNPWRRVSKEWPHVSVIYEDLGKQWAETRWMTSGRMFIVLNERLNQAERRVCVAHECTHLEAGRPHGGLRASQEAAIRAATASWLLPDLEQIGHALAAYDAHRAADDLWVTWPVLVDRLNGLTDAESQYVHSFREDIA